jgi:hypothetical protein
MEYRQEIQETRLAVLKENNVNLLLSYFFMRGNVPLGGVSYPLSRKEGVPVFKNTT